MGSVKTMTVIKGFEDGICPRICPDCGGIMDFDEGLFFCDHCCIIFEWGGCYHDFIGTIDNCW